MKKQHWRRRSLFPNKIVKKRKITVLQRGSRREGLMQSSQEPDVMDVNHRQLIKAGVLNNEQMSLFQRLLERTVIDGLCACHVVQTYYRLGASLDRFAMRLFLEIGSQISGNHGLNTFERRVDYINSQLGFRFNLALPKTLILNMHLTLNEWVNQKTDQTALYESIKIEQLMTQLNIQKKYWLKLANEKSSASFANQQLQEIQNQQCELKKQVGGPDESGKRVIESHQVLVNEWQPILESLMSLSEYSKTSDKFVTEWKVWCAEARLQAPELSDVWNACDQVYSDLNAVAKIWQWFQNMQTVGHFDHYYFDVQSDLCGHVCNHLSQI